MSTTVMNHTQTVIRFSQDADARKVAMHLNYKPDAPRVYVTRNGDSLEIRPVASVSREVFDDLVVRAERLCENLFE